MRKCFKVYKYTVTVDGVEKKIEGLRRLDYKATCRNYYNNGAENVRITFDGCYIWNE